jgi:hypothetical protein
MTRRTIRITWVRQQSATTTFHVSLGFDRIASQLVPEKNNLGPRISVSGLSTVGPQQDIPIDRAENMFRQAAQARLLRGQHEWTAGYELLRRYLNGVQNDSALGSFSFTNDQGRDAITNLRLGCRPRSSCRWATPTAASATGTRPITPATSGRPRARSRLPWGCATRLSPCPLRRPG